MKIKKLQNEARAEKKVTFTQDYNKRRGLSHGSWSWTRRFDNYRAMMSTPRSFTRGNFRPNNQNCNNFRNNRAFERRNYPNNNNNRSNDYRANSPYHSDRDQSRNLGSNNNYSRSLSTSQQDSSFTDFCRQPRSSSPTHQCFIGSESETRATIYPMTRNSQLPTMVTSQT